MKTENVFIAHPVTNAQVNALKAVVKAMKVDFEIKKEPLAPAKESSKKEVIKNLKRGFEEMALIKKGKLKTTPLKDFLREL